MASTASSWTQLRPQARQLETQTEKALVSYSQLASLSNTPAQPTEDEQRLDSQITDLLTERERVLGQLARSLDAEAEPSALKTSYLSRHRENLQQHRQEHSRLKAQLGTARDRANLLSSVRADIAAYRAANPESAEAEYMLAERARLDNSHAMTDGLLSQAYAVSDNFSAQREQLENVRRRVTTAVSLIPGVNGIIQRISIKRRRDGIVLGSFIALCFLIFLYFI